MTAELGIAGSGLSRTKVNVHPRFELLQQACPHIELYSPHSKGWTERRKIRCLEAAAIDPLAIAVPKNSNEVASLVSEANSLGLKIAARSGGNDFYGRNVFPDCLVIDMRRIGFVEVAGNRKSAKIGGGIIQASLVEELYAYGLTTPFANTGMLGYVGWATLGGYGPLVATHGMGYDQILAAEVVNDGGKVVDADQEMLEGLRGMGGNLGVVTSLTIKVYPASDLFSGIVVYESSKITNTIRKYQYGLSRLQIPATVTLHQFILQNPGIGGRAFCVLWHWTGPDMDAARNFLSEFLKATPPTIMNTVEQISPPEALRRVPAPPATWGAQRSIYIRSMSPKILDIVLKSLQSMPVDPGVNIGWTDIAAENPSFSKNRSLQKASFGLAYRHCLLTFSYSVLDKANLERAKLWNEQLYDEIRNCDDKEVLDSAYIPLTRPGDRTPSQFYGDRWDRVQELKARYDPSNVFSLAVPTLTL